MGKAGRIFMIGIFLAVLTPGMLGAAEKREIATDELKSILADVKGWAAAATDLRNKSSAMNAQDFIKEAETLRGKLEEVIITIAGTRPSPSNQQGAMLLAMGTKGVELGLWHYIYGALTNSRNGMEYGDTLVGTAAGQIEAAAQLLEKSGS